MNSTQGKSWLSKTTKAKIDINALPNDQEQILKNVKMQEAAISQEFKTKTKI